MMPPQSPRSKRTEVEGDRDEGEVALMCLEAVQAEAKGNETGHLGIPSSCALPAFGRPFQKPG